MCFSFILLFDLKDYQTGNSRLDTLVGAILAALATMLFITVYSFVRTSARLRSLEPELVENSRDHFIANHIEVFNQNNLRTSFLRPEGKDDALDGLIDRIRNNKQRYYFLIAPTGIGKTTFL